MQPRINKWLDLLDRVGWTGIQAAAAAGVTYLTTDTDMGWKEAVTFVGVAAIVSVLKVVIGQNTGTDESGSLIGQPVIEPPPEA